MGKYEPLGAFLRKQRGQSIAITFAEIEKIVGSKLPKSQRYPAWWSNNPWNNVMTQVWLDAGFETESVDVEAGKLIFRKVSDKRGTSGTTEKSKKAGKHPLIGWMKGTVTVPPGVDITKPADPEWGDLAWGRQSNHERR